MPHETPTKRIRHFLGKYTVFHRSGDCWIDRGGDPRVLQCSGPRGTCQVQLMRGDNNVAVIAIFNCDQGGTLTIDSSQITIEGYDIAHRFDLVPSWHGK